VLRIQFYKELTQPRQVEARRAVILDCFGNPLALAVEESPQTYIYSCRDNPDFEMLLRSLGIDRTTVSTILEPRKLPEIWTP